MNRPVRALVVAAALTSFPARGASPARTVTAPAATPAVEVDVARAFAAAREQKALLLVDVWAPW